MTAPSIASFLVFVRNVMGISVAYLPDNSPIVQHAFDTSLNIANPDLGLGDSQTTSWSPYEQAVYNLGGHLLVEYAPDATYAISALSWAAGIATATTPVAHAIMPGDRLTITAVSPLGYSGSTINGVRQSFVVAETVPDTLHFGYLLSTNPGTATLLVGAAATEQYFSRLRSQFKMTSFAPGVVTSANDLSTGAGLLNPDFMRGFTLEDLQLLKTPWGRSYLSIAQKYGPAVWGLT